MSFLIIIAIIRLLFFASFRTLFKTKCRSSRHVSSAPLRIIVDVIYRFPSLSVDSAFAAPLPRRTCVIHSVSPMIVRVMAFYHFHSIRLQSPKPRRSGPTDLCCARCVLLLGHFMFFAFHSRCPNGLSWRTCRAEGRQ